MAETHKAHKAKFTGSATGSEVRSQLARSVEAHRAHRALAEHHAREVRRERELLQDAGVAEVAP